jgi:protein-S-isoprenylcysteine O-methyltransferase Ste14
MGSWAAIARRIRVPTGFVVAALYLWLARPSVESLATGAAFVIAGLSVRGWASGHLEKNERLATAGPYAYTRNPLYLGSLILAVGFAIAARSWWIALALFVMFVAIYLPVIQAEEQFLAERFPEFANYASEVGRLIPRLTNVKKSNTRFSWNLYTKHSEYHATLGAAAILGVLIAKLLWKP